MNGITELAKLLKERENGDGYSPIFGTVIELPNTKIRISDKVILTDSHITLCINLKEQNSDGEYVNLGKTVVLLPYAKGREVRFLRLYSDGVIFRLCLNTRKKCSFVS